MDWRHPEIYLSKSPIHGFGSFAKKRLKKGEILFIFGGRPFIPDWPSINKMEKRKRDVFFRSLIPLGGGFYLGCPDNFQKPVESRRINHSCAPNLAIEGQIMIKARREIAPGEELSLDYGSAFFSDDKITVIENCLCQTALCRKRVKSDDWRDLTLRKRYGRDFSIALLKKMGLKPWGL